LYDSGAGQFYPNQVRPLNSSAFSYLDDWAARIVAEFPQSAFADDLAVTNYEQWMLNTFKSMFIHVYVRSSSCLSRPSSVRLLPHAPLSPHTQTHTHTHTHTRTAHSLLVRYHTCDDTVALQSTPYNQTASPDYVNSTAQLLRRQVALAGYRLAQALDLALANVTIPDGPSNLRGAAFKPSKLGHLE
jgi:carbohydrate-binding DOMON domain-containing protein